MSEKLKHRKLKAKQSPIEDVRVIEFTPGDFRPLFIKASDIDRVVVGLSPKTLANWRSQGVGPIYSSVSGSIYYRLSTLEEFFGGNEVKTFNSGESS